MPMEPRVVGGNGGNVTCWTLSLLSLMQQRQKGVRHISTFVIKVEARSSLSKLLEEYF